MQIEVVFDVDNVSLDMLKVSEKTPHVREIIKPIVHIDPAQKLRPVTR